jgi:hypothetical protein
MIGKISQYKKGYMFIPAPPLITFWLETKLYFSTKSKKRQIHSFYSLLVAVMVPLWHGPLVA